MRAVKCPVSDVTASTAPTQGQREEEPLIYGQHYCNPSTTCRPDSAFHLKTTGSMAELIPISYLSLSNPPSSPPAWCCCEVSALFVCLFHSVSKLASPSLPLRCFSFPPCLSHINTLEHSHKYTSSPALSPPTLITCSDDAS